jgi:hypothetical protein
MPRPTGFPGADAEDDFQRARRRQILVRLAQRLRREPDDVGVVLPFDEVVAALGALGERDVGLQMVPIDSIIGTVDRKRDFDRQFRPTSARVRERWQRIAAAERRGEPIPPISLYRVGELHFVRDGHNRVSVAKAHGRRYIEAYVVEVLTRLPASGIRFRSDLVVKDYERLFLERVPLPAEAASQLHVDDPWSWCELSETVEAWGFRLMQHERGFLPRPEVAERWYEDEYKRVVRMLRAADLIGDQTEAEAYLRVAAERYRLIRTHEWSDEIIDILRPLLRR